MKLGRIVSVLLIISFITGLLGCEAVQRKFTRKRKRGVIRPRFYQEGMAETRPKIELYMMHYIYWKTWQEELIDNAGKNSKRDRMAAAEALARLADMKKYLIKEKAEELSAYIGQIKKLTDEITSGGLTPMRIGLIRQKLSNLKSRITRKFYYKKVREYIKPD